MFFSSFANKISYFLQTSSAVRQVEFGVNAEAQKFLSKNGKSLSEAITAFTLDINTLINKTIEDTMITAKQYEAARWGTRHFLFPASCLSHLRRTCCDRQNDL